MSSERNILTRRSLMATALAAAAGTALEAAQAPEVAAGTAQSKAPTGVAGKTPRTLVCFYLIGGSDGNSLVAPLEPTQYAAYSRARGELGLRSSALLPIRDRSTGASYGLDPRLPELQTYFDAGSAALVANVGTPERPSEAQRYGSIAFLSDGYMTTDWAAKKVSLLPNSNLAFTFDRGVSLMPLSKTEFQGERRKNPALMEKVASATFRTAFPDTIAGRQARVVAGVLRAGNVSGASGGQVIVCPLGGFGPSSVQMMEQAPLLRQLSAGMAALYEATVEMGISDQITIYTDSEYGRSLRPNGNHTAAPGWGNHQFVLGGAVRGGQVYGKYPDMLKGPFEADGALIPTTAESQYQATLAGWLGLAPVELQSLLPDLDGKPRLGFLPA